ncbi:Twinfilin [Eumeta japonica]|uniref:Twinfilin n=1 Tax=Eumeta variegata TaxID=151549 RepID=A0A4C1UR02_EUMVA|nr:Twinfilin [Eumeta japonica]
MRFEGTLYIQLYTILSGVQDIGLKATDRDDEPTETEIHDGLVFEQLCLSKCYPTKGSWEQDFDKYISGLIVDDQPCYILYRFDSKNSVGHEWLFLSWSPDSAPVRQKMLYASTKATLKLEFGSAHIKDEMHATVKEEASLKGYQNHLSGVSAPAPLTEREEALKELQINDHSTNFGTDSIPNLEEEKILLSKAANISLKNLPEQVPSDQARYHLYIFKHTHEGDPTDSIGYNCSIKERMMYSSCKGQFLETIEKTGIEIAKKLEIDDGKELTEEFLYDEIHPKRNLHRPAFAKPKGPPNRGAKRITKTQDAQ